MSFIPQSLSSSSSPIIILKGTFLFSLPSRALFVSGSFQVSAYHLFLNLLLNSIFPQIRHRFYSPCFSLFMVGSILSVSSNTSSLASFTPSLFSSSISLAISTLLTSSLDFSSWSKLAFSSSPSSSSKMSFPASSC